MATDDKSNFTDLPAKPMKGKYDGRKTNGRYKSAVKRGPKPKWMQHLSRNKASEVLRQFDSIASPAEIYAAAWEKGKFELCADMYKQFQDRLHGRPFIAENPAKVNKSDALEQDDRLQKAIKELVPQKQSVKSVM
jgi:hypothetical protein